MSFFVGEMVGAYRIIEQLGQGGMATVFKAYHPALDRYVAIKVLHPAFLEDSNFLARFQREARVVARLEHTNIVPIYDFAEHGGRPYLVMKYVEGVTLKARLAERRLTLTEILPIVEAVGAGLAYAHQQGVLHRDVKPSNVLLTRDGQIYLADFGLARMAQMGESSLTSDRMVGTPQYMSPEQAMSKPNLDARTDIYSFGVMLYEMAVGRVPFNADTPFAVIHDHIYTPLPPPRQVNPAVSEALERVLLKALAKDPADRFEDVQQMIGAFRAVVMGDTPPATPEVAPTYVTGATMVGAAQAPDEAPEMASNIPQAMDTTPAPAVLAAGGDTAVAAGSSGAAKTGSFSQPKKKMSKKWWFIGCGGLLLVTLVCLAAGSRFLRQRVVEQIDGMSGTYEATLEAQEATLAPMLTALPGGDEPTADVSQGGGSDEDVAQDSIEAAVVAWRANDMAAAGTALEQARQQIGTDTDLYRRMMGELIDEDAWLLAAMFLPDLTRQPTALGPQQVMSVHQILYMAARDPQAGPYFDKARPQPLAAVAEQRFQYYYGDQKQAIQRLDKILKDQALVKRFPEARLLDAEIAFANKENNRAAKILDNLLADKNIPEWVRDLAGELQDEIQ